MGQSSLLIVADSDKPAYFFAFVSYIHYFFISFSLSPFFFLLFFLPFFSFFPYRPRLLSSSSYIWSSYLT